VLRLALALALVVTTSGMALDDELPPGGTFIDDNDSVHESSIEGLHAAGLTSGCNPPWSDRFCPGEPVTRGQMAAFLRRAKDLAVPATDYFVDDDGSIFEGDIKAIRADGITYGCNPPLNDEFCPGRHITRGQFASMLVRAFELPEAEEDFFSDDDESVHQGSINAVAAAAITFGCDPDIADRFCPDADVSRGQMASFLVRVLGIEPIDPPPPPPPPGEESCITGAGAPTGTTVVVPGETAIAGPGTVWEFRIAIEEGLAVDAACFASEVLRILNDPRGWGAEGALTFRKVDTTTPSPDFTLYLTSPAATDALCAPVPTGGIYSCRNGSRVVLNFWRWQNGASPFAGDMTTYRQYLVNHEVGHRLGHGHTVCATAGSSAPVMQQQTKFVAPCVPNGWPLASER
jgi:hypothetical protein